MSEDKSLLVKEIEKIQHEYQNDIRFDEFTLKEFQLKVPGLKAKWSAILSINETYLQELNEKKDLVKTALINEITKKDLRPLSDVAKENLAKKDSRYVGVLQKIKKQVVINKYLERVHNNIQNVTWDLKNILDELKIENM